MKSMHHLAQGHLHFERMEDFKQWLWMGNSFEQKGPSDV